MSLNPQLPQNAVSNEARLAAGTLYDALHRLVMAGLVVEAANRPAPKRDDSRRRYYTLTVAGRQLLCEEMVALEAVVKLGSDRLLREAATRGAGA